MDDQLCNTVVTGRTLAKLLAESPEIHCNGHELVSVEAKIIGENQGFTSTVIRVALKWSDPSADLPETVIVKVMGSNAMDGALQHLGKEQLDFIRRQLNRAHNTECTIYEIEELKRVVARPECYAKIRSKSDSDEPGVIVLEDMGDRAVAMPVSGWADGLRPPHVDQVVDILASLHAWSVNRTEWRKVIPTLREFNPLAFLIDTMVDMFPASKAKFPELFKDVDEAKIRGYVSAEKYVDLFGDDPKVRYNLPLVMVHGDVHVMNMMFEKEPDSTAGDRLVVMLDWQMVHQGCAAEDLARILVIGLSTEQRRGQTENIVRRYVQLFNSKLDNPGNQITYEDTKRALDDMFAFFAVMWTCAVSMIDQMQDMMKNLDEQTLEAMKKSVMDSYYHKYNDALDILKW